MHGLGHRDEAGLTPQRDQGQSVLFGRLHQRGRELSKAATEFDDEPAGADAGELGHVRPQGRVVPGQGDARGQDDLSSAEEPCDVGQLADVHPAHFPVEVGRTGQNGRLPTPHHRKGEDVRHAGQPEAGQ